MSDTVQPASPITLGDYIKQLQAVGDKPYKSDKPSQPTESNFHPDIIPERDGSFTVNVNDDKSTICGDPDNCIGCQPYSCAKLDPNSHYFNGYKWQRCHYSVESTPKRKGIRWWSWISYVIEYTSKTCIKAVQSISSGVYRTGDSTRNTDSRPDLNGHVKSSVTYSRTT